MWTSRTDRPLRRGKLISMEHFRWVWPRKAVSIVEILVAIAILSVGIYGVADLVMNSRKHAHLSSLRVTADAFARLKAAELTAASATPQGAKFLAGAATKGFWPAETPVAMDGNDAYTWNTKLSPRKETTSTLDAEISVWHTTQKDPLLRATFPVVLSAEVAQ
jgi:hypothetical protein